MILVTQLFVSNLEADMNEPASEHNPRL
jgi:hypothetical protein